ncbi:hypothetical protein [Parabacteroides faecis]|uniref:hypothetical protein n=1 Tax=Parabacteroides faecis TaxID=1217282 RepID=UPI002165ECB1|nr:hypothetical protein [Parabacteroides faecis]MCS2889636.1 hypothetical protein [Parabacteroides faecis]
MKKTVFTAPMAALLLLSCAQAPQEKGKEITYTPQAPYNPPTYVCYKAPAPIKIDGKLSPRRMGCYSLDNRLCRHRRRQTPQTTFADTG